MISLSRPSAITAISPAPVTMRAASSLLLMPPVPRELPGPSAYEAISFVISVTSPMSLAPPDFFGSAVISPSMSERMRRRSAFTRFATRALSLSLSPNLISSAETVSFSLMTGITREARRVVMVFLALRCRTLSWRSSWVRRIWATWWPYFSKHLS